MPRRGRKKKFKLNLKLDIRPEVIKSILAVIFLLSGALALISFIAPGYTLNSKVQEILRGLFGFPSILLAIILVFTGLLLIDSIKFRFLELRVLLGLIGLLITSSAMLHLFYLRSASLEDARNGVGGGMIGYKLLDILRGMLSIYGAVLVLGALAVISVLLTFNITIDQVVTFLKEKLLAIKSKKDATEEGQGDIEFSSNVDEAGEELSDEGVAIAVSKAASGASFEVLPSISEPQEDNTIPVLKQPVNQNELVSLAPTLPYADKVWELPPLDLLEEPSNVVPDSGDIRERGERIVKTLKSFGIDVVVKPPKVGPAVTQYSLEAAAGTKISKIASLQYDLALALESPTGSVRIEAPIPGKALIGIEVPNNNRVNVSFKSLLQSESMKAMKSKLGIVLGKDVGGNSLVHDVGKMPHLLIAGATGSGKSIFLHSTIFSLLYRASPQEVKFILVDPKRVELVHYQDIPHLMTPVITEIDKAASVFKWAVSEMERRYKLFESAKARNIDSYNEMSGFQIMPYIVIVVDELGEIMVADPAAVEKSIIRLAQLARATGIHLVLSVQRPSTNVITGLIKANIPCRIAFNVSSQIDSRVVIDQPGAEKLLGKGDMLFLPPDAAKPVRLQGAWVSEREVANLVNYLKAQGVEPNYREEIFDVPADDTFQRGVSAGRDGVDDLFDEAVDVVVSSGKASASLLQRRLSIGYARAARILDELEEKGVVGPANGSKPRDILARRDDDFPTPPDNEGY